jgi:hypothetical protein
MECNVCMGGEWVQSLIFGSTNVQARVLYRTIGLLIARDGVRYECENSTVHSVVQEREN